MIAMFVQTAGFGVMKGTHNDSPWWQRGRYWIYGGLIIFHGNAAGASILFLRHNHRRKRDKGRVYILIASLCVPAASILFTPSLSENWFLVAHAGIELLVNVPLLILLVIARFRSWWRSRKQVTNDAEIGSLELREIQKPKRVQPPKNSPSDVELLEVYPESVSSVGSQSINYQKAKYNKVTRI
jgi:hypothetical protein